ncbi:MAG: hypothetical protein KIC76_00595 [Firmicutes bacterium]|jgi:hypothetical protein|nr:hypothetical protein [Bacillota bacterium]
MFLEKYLNPTYLHLVYNNYEDFYLKSLDEENFYKVYMLLKQNNFYFIEDIILNYLELFEIDVEYVENAILDVKAVLKEDFVNKIGKNMEIIDKIIELAIKYGENKITNKE